MISDNGVSKVWREEGWIYKKQPKHLAQNELWGLQQMSAEGYAPHATYASKELTQIEDLGESEQITDRDEFLSHLPKILSALENAGIRHGDLTDKALIVKDNKPYVIDFAESRMWDDPRPDKREGGDEWWLTKTMLRLAMPMLCSPMLQMSTAAR